MASHSLPNIPTTTHLQYLSQCLALAKQSPPKPSNFRVGAILLLRRYPSPSNSDKEELQDRILSTGYTLELQGNTHAEQCCLSKFASQHNISEERIGEILDQEREDGGTPDQNAQIEMYVTMEPCGKRLSGNTPCVERIIQTRTQARRGVDRVYFGVKEPGTFVGESEGCKRLDDAGIQWSLVEGMEDEILQVAMAGHPSREEEVTNIDDISEEERKRQDAMPRNPKKRMMEV
ncbi:hypothetical protein FQN57_002846 [Myotisia sp. PD_48]|nr:hypothetical protein FQN57_002846 [Myotisia sp. PD_48]